MSLAKKPSEKEVFAPKQEKARAPRPIRWTSAQYHQMGEANVFLNERVQLINGRVIEMSPIGSRHFAAALEGSDALRIAFGKGFSVSVQNPVHLADGQEPEPDLAVIIGRGRDYVNALPTNPVLVVEISDTTLFFDRNTKARVYALAGIAEFWIVNLPENVLEVYRNPVNGKYDPKVIYQKGQSVAPLAAPQSLVLVDDLLP